MDDQQLTDLSYLREVTTGDEEIIIETTQVFLNDTPDAVKILRDCFANQEWEQMSKQAHKIKPGLKYMGMQQALELLVEIEEQAKSGDIRVNLGSKVKEFSTLCSKAFEELSEKVEKLKSQKP